MHAWVGLRIIAWLKVLPLLFMMGILSGCDPITLTALGVGSAAGVQHTLSGVAYKTFTLPLPKLRKAVQTALSRMSIKVNAPEKMENGEVIKARTADRDVEVELEVVSPNTTRMRSIVHKGVLMDAATATEIIIQTEKAIGAS